MLFSFLKKFDVEETKKTLFSLNATDREAFLSQNLQVADNEEIAYLLMKETPSSIRLLSKRLRNDKDIVRFATNFNPSLLHYASKRLQSQKDLVDKAMVSDPEYYGDLLPELKMDKDYVLLFLKKQPSAISHIPQEFFDKHLDVAEAVLKRSGLALEKLSPKIQDNESLVRIAIESSGVGFQYASSRLRNKDELAELVLETRPYAFKYCSDRIRANRGMALRAISKCGVLLPDLVSNGKTFIDDKEAVMAALKQDGSTFQYVGDTLKHDMDLAVIAIAQNPIAVNSLNSKERIQPKIMEALAQKDLFKFSFVIMSLNMEDKEKGLGDFDILLKGKSQEYLLTTIKNASDSRLGNLELNNDFNVCVKMVLKNATKETLEAMKEYSIREPNLNSAVQEALDRVSLLSIPQQNIDALYAHADDGKHSKTPRKSLDNLKIL